MDAGSLADWVGAVGGLLAVFAAVVSWQTSEKVVKLEEKRDRERESAAERRQAKHVAGSSPVEWCNRFVSFGLGYALSWSGVSSCWVGCGVSRDLVRMSRLR